MDLKWILTCTLLLAFESVHNGSSQGCDPFLRPKLKGGPEEELASDSSTADEEELKEGEAGGGRPTISSQSMRHSCEAASHHESGTSTEGAPFSGEVEQTMKSRRTFAGSKRRRTQQTSPEKPVKEKESNPIVGTRAAESSGSPKLRGPLVDAQEGSNSLIVESSRDSRRLMQGARQVWP